jgi:capsular polysaccharide biosynthesis protein
VDLRSTLSILRRQRRALAIAAALGLAAGIGFALLRPPLYSSTSQVLLPPTQQSDGQAIPRNVDTEIRIATSEEVLGPAGDAVTPSMSAEALGKRVNVSAPTPDVLVIAASAATPARAEALSRAVANSEVRYVKGATSSLTNAEQAALQRRQEELEASLATVGAEIKKTDARQLDEDAASVQGRADAAAMAQLTAQQADLVLQIDQLKERAAISNPDASASIIQEASPAKRPGLIARSVIFALLGLVIATIIASVVLVLRARRDQKLRYRDEIADALGSPVIASLPSKAPRAVAGWTTLLETYAPGTVDAWALRQALRQLALDGSAGAREHGGGAAHHPLSITVITLSDDLRGLAIGPQVAAYAASSGVRTALVTGQGHESAAALWAACAQVTDEVRPGLLVENHPDEIPEVELTVVMAVVDRRDPRFTGVPESSVTILAVSSGSATAEELALTAVRADDAEHRIIGIIVADPDNLDRTTGRLLQHERSQQIALPTRLTGVPGSVSGAGNVSGLRRRPR